MPRVMLLALVSWVLAACSRGDSAEVSTSSTTDDQGGDGDTIPTEGGDPAFNSNYRGILSGITLDGTYTRVRVGHFDAVDADGCCSDYVLAGPAQNHVRILFGATSRGLVFLSDAPDQSFDMGPANVGIADIVVLDINEDGHDDVLALRSDGIVGIRHGLAAAAPAPVLSDSLLEASLKFEGIPASRSLVVAGLDCGGKNDLVAVSPTNDRVIYALAAPGDSFMAPQAQSTGLGSPRQVTVGDLNGDSKPDIVTGNGDGSASVILNKCGSPNVIVGDIIAAMSRSDGLEDARHRLGRPRRCARHL